MITLRPDELIIDSFAGGGGASAGIEMALGRAPDIAINHDAEAVAMHAANHPATTHFCQSVWRVRPEEVTRGRPVGLLWASPDCKHFSKAKGAKPVEKNIRDLAWVVVLWARQARPRVIMLENVEEFRDWGPLITAEDGRIIPCPLRKGLTFRRFVRELRRLGYKVEHRELRACDYGAPTIRKRLFLIARRDGEPIVWPKPTHGPGLLPYRTAAGCIDWSIPCPSIFGRARPLAEKTMARIARGIRRYVIEAANPFIAPVTHASDLRSHPVTEPFRTITTASRGEQALVVPHITKFRGGSTGHGADEPMHTVTANSFQKRPGGATPLGMVGAFLKPRYGERPGQEPRALPIEGPMPTVVPTGNGGDLVTAFLAKHYGGHETPGASMARPFDTITSKDHHAMVAAHLLNLKGSDRRAAPADAPAPTITGGGMHVAEVRAFLLKYYETAIGQRLDEPAHTATTKARLGLVTVEGVDYQIVDIGMRMLSPRELFRAQGFADSYIIDRGPDGKPLTKTAQIRMCGNSVCPPIAAAIVRANLGVVVEPRDVAA